MTTTTVTARTGTAATPSSPGLLALSLIELRKMVDTRAGRWILVLTGLAMAALTVGMTLNLEKIVHQNVVEAATGMVGMAPSLLIPVVVILSVTTEWSQRTALTTFTLEPRRGRVYLAKGIAAVVVALVSWAVASVLGWVCVVVGTSVLDVDVTVSLDAAMTIRAHLAMVVMTLMGFALGMLLRNSAAAIVIFAAVPAILQTIGTLGGEKVVGWLDIAGNTSTLAYAEGTATQWAQLGVSITVWVIIPLVVGTLRQVRADVQ